MRENCFIRQKFLVRQSRERLPEFEFRPATRLPGIYMYKYTKSGRILQFFVRFFHGAGRNPGQTGRSGGHLFRRRQNLCPRDAGAGKDTEAGGEKARKGKTGRAQRDREAGTDETEYPRGIFSDQRFALA